MMPLSPAHAQLRPVPRRANQVLAGTHTFRHNGIARSYVVRAPDGLNRNSAPVPVVLVLHGGGGNAANAEQMTGFTRLVERERILVVYPEGTSQRPRIPLLTWNASHCCGYAMKSGVDDVGFISALLDTLSATYPVDPARIYVTGMSNGGMMSHRLGRELSHRVAAIAPVVGAIFGDEPAPAHPVSAIMINGLLDKSVPSTGGLGGGRGASQWDGTPTRPALEQGSYWARANGCTAAPVTQESGTDRVTRYECPTNRRVEVHLLSDNGHAWPGGKAGSRMGDTPTHGDERDRRDLDVLCQRTQAVMVSGEVTERV
jgi:polyhydroxybutyrate depolymerase